MPMDPNELKAKISAGLLSFPVTHFDRHLDFDEGPFRDHIDWLISHGPAALFAAGGTGEFFSLSQDELPPIIAAAVGSSS